MPRTQGRVRPLLALCAAVALILTGCSGGGGKGAKSSTTTSTSTTSTTSTTSPPTSKPSPSTSTGNWPAGTPAAAKAHTDAGAAAFALYYLRTVNRLGKNPRTGVLPAFSEPTCNTCANFSQTQTDLVRQRHHFTCEQFIQLRITSSAQSVSGYTTLTTRQPVCKEVDSTGQTVKTNPSYPETSLAVLGTWKTGRWLISKIQSLQS